MTEDQIERLVQSFERIAERMEDICVIGKRWCDHEYPERREPREAVVSRIKTEEDLNRERQGAGDGSISNWFGGYEEESFAGERERAFLEERRKSNAGAPLSPQAGQGQGSPEAAGRKPRGRRKRAAGDGSPEVR